MSRPTRGSRRRPQPEPLPERLARFHEAVAVVSDGSRQVGHLATRIETWWEREGPWWRRRWINPDHDLEWVLDLRPGPWQDGVVPPGDLAEELDDLEADRFVLRDDVWQLRWLEGDDLRQAWAERGWDPRQVTPLSTISIPPA